MSKKVLTVDDSVTVREVLRTTLTEAGYTVIVASNGQEAMRFINSSNIDMLVTDLNMPEMDGIELIRAFRQTPGHRFTPVIMLTTENRDNLKQDVRKTGASGWINKPFRPDQLLAVTRMVCPVHK